MEHDLDHLGIVIAGGMAMTGPVTARIISGTTSNVATMSSARSIRASSMPRSRASATAAPYEKGLSYRPDCTGGWRGDEHHRRARRQALNSYDEIKNFCSSGSPKAGATLDPTRTLRVCAWNGPSCPEADTHDRPHERRGRLDSAYSRIARPAIPEHGPSQISGAKLRVGPM